MALRIHFYWEWLSNIHCRSKSYLAGHLDGIFVPALTRWAYQNWRSLFILYLFYKFIYLLMVVLGLHCCMQAFCSCSKPGLLFVAMPELLIAVASFVIKHRLQRMWASVLVLHRLHSSMACGRSQEQGSNPYPLHRQAILTWFLTTGPPGRSLPFFSILQRQTHIEQKRVRQKPESSIKGLVALENLKWAAFCNCWIA